LANWVTDAGPLAYPISSALPAWYPIPTKFGFDQIFLINLERRPERREKMEEILRLVGIEFKRIEAIDGHKLSQKQISEIKFLPGYFDPFHRRPMKLGEIGCFLSHLKIWEEIVGNGLQRAIVLEDDVRFTANATIMFVLQNYLCL
jgi:collagen beta-1,O-galactosyltransferase